ncbi:putative ribosomal protein s14 protein [Neofusicoccum parvum UCRNP2]|uniref:Putative ribosomal protein s14 protein n=1 Tax=Botryosphaeria parva (strain UCR-NP2) TaxID=1287680 RepID=R1FXY4_BOTPV|nr:putative ribosomal protein s14 protein [Neofusicoccum parvum UCRNP2]
MFRLSEAGMPEDPSYPPNLKQLGYFIDEKSEIRTIKPPHNYYNFWISNNDRVNESFREAMHACIKEEVVHRMAALGIPPLYLPHLTLEKPQNEPSVPILVTSKDELKKKKRIIVVINDDFQDLGLWAYRIASKEHGVEAGSVISLAKAMQTNQFAAQAAVDGTASKPAEDVPFEVPDNWKTPGLVVLNPGQLLYSYRLDKAVTKQSWDSQPLKSGIDPVPKIDPAFNKIKDNRTVDEHVKTSFDKILKNPEWVSPEANIYFVGLGNGGDALLRVLSKEWPSYKDRVAAIALTDPAPIHELFDDHDFVAFLRHRARALVPSPEEFSTPVAVPASTDHPEEVKQRKDTNEFAKSQMSTTQPASPWLEEMNTTTPNPFSIIMAGASDALTSSISQLAIDSIVKSPTEPIRTTPAHSDEWGYHYYPILSSGERIFGEVIFPVSQRAILAWFETVANTPNYRNPLFKVPEVKPEGLEDADIYDATKEQGVLVDDAENINAVKETSDDKGQGVLKDTLHKIDSGNEGAGGEEEGVLTDVTNKVESDNKVAEERK